ncbi:MAG: PHP domain-containing protein [Methermicoccaceae archaeon]
MDEGRTTWVAGRLKELLERDNELKRCDMHVHSSYSSDVPDVPSQHPIQRLLAALERGMDYFVLTDHNTMAGYSHLIEELSHMGEIGRLARERVISGVELSCRCAEVGEVHTNVFGLDEHQFEHINGFRDDSGLVRLEKLIPYLDSEGIVFGLNHPLWQPPHNNITTFKVVREVLTGLINPKMHNGEAISEKMVESLYGHMDPKDVERVYNGTLEIAGQFSFIEVNGSRVKTMNDIAEHIASQVGVPLCAGSDDHYGETLGLCHTIVRADDKWEFLERLEKGEGEVVRKDTDFTNSCMRFVNFIRLTVECDSTNEVVNSLFESKLGKVSLLIAPKFIRLLYRSLNNHNPKAQRAVEIMASSYLRAQSIDMDSISVM